MSFGQVSVNLLKEFFKMELSPSLFFVGQPDLSCHTGITEEFSKWLSNCSLNALENHSKDFPCIKLWHLNNSLSSVSHKQILLTFYELDSPTSAEINAVKNNSLVLFSSDYSMEQFKNLGCNNVGSFKLGFDAETFKVIEYPYFKDRIIFTLAGKFEKRKHHLKTMKAWASKYGNNPKYVLNCALNNDWNKNYQSQIHNAFEGEVPNNFNFIPYLLSNSEYNDYLNAGNIVLAMSGGEGWGLPEFQSVALGKYCVGLNAHGYSDWMTAKNTVIVNPSGKIDAEDGVFFSKGTPFNQGKIFTWEEEEFLAACDKAIELYKGSPVNTEGLKLASQFTWEKSAKDILTKLQGIA